MQKQDNNFQPLGGCHRLVNFIISTLIFRNPKSPQSLTQQPMVDSARNRQGSMGEKQPIHPATPNEEERVHRALVESKHDSGTEIEVEFKETEQDLEYWTPVDNLGVSVHEPERDGPPIGKERAAGLQKAIVQEDQLLKDKDMETSNKIKELQPVVEVKGISNGITKSQVEGGDPHNLTNVGSRGGGPKKNVSLQDSAEEEVRKKKGKNIVLEHKYSGDNEEEKKKRKDRKNMTRDKLTIAMESDDTREKPLILRHPRPLLNEITSNINEKADAFILRMRGNLGSHPT